MNFEFSFLMFNDELMTPDFVPQVLSMERTENISSFCCTALVSQFASSAATTGGEAYTKELKMNVEVMKSPFNSSSKETHALETTFV